MHLGLVHSVYGLPSTFPALVELISFSGFSNLVLSEASPECENLPLCRARPLPEARRQFLPYGFFHAGFAFGSSRVACGRMPSLSGFARWGLDVFSILSPIAQLRRRSGFISCSASLVALLL